MFPGFPNGSIGIFERVFGLMLTDVTKRAVLKITLGLDFLKYQLNWKLEILELTIFFSSALVIENSFMNSCCVVFTGSGTDI
jgi:hypothetical protein